MPIKRKKKKNPYEVEIMVTHGAAADIRLQISMLNEAHLSRKDWQSQTEYYYRNVEIVILSRIAEMLRKAAYMAEGKGQAVFKIKLLKPELAVVAFNIHKNNSTIDFFIDAYRFVVFTPLNTPLLAAKEMAAIRSYEDFYNQNPINL